MSAVGLEVIVIGAGIAGAAAALSLSREGAVSDQLEL